MKKICTGCGDEKELDLFHKETAGKFGRKSKCAECVTVMSQKWKKENPQRTIEGRMKWNAQNKDKHNQATYKWRKSNAKQHNAYVAQYQRERKAVDPKFKLLSNMRSLMWNHLTRKDLKKHKKLEGYLGCKFEDFVTHIEQSFDQFMSWDNYGSYWSMDHVCPCNQAKTEEEMIKLQFYTNLRPMKTHGEDGNFAKSDNKTPEAEELCLKLLGRSWID